MSRPDYTREAGLQALRKVMIDQTEYYGTVHGPNSAEYNRIVSVGFGLATELYGSDPEAPGRREFIRWLFGKDEG